MKFISFLITLIIGVAFGIGITLYAPEIVGKYLPTDVGGTLKNVKGEVVAKGMKDKELLLTINTPEGAMLSTFRKNIEKIDLLVSNGDTIEIKISGYRPFIEDPIIARVKKPSRNLSTENVPESANKETSPIVEKTEPTTQDITEKETSENTTGVRPETSVEKEREDITTGETETPETTTPDDSPAPENTPTQPSEKGEQM